MSLPTVSEIHISNMLVLLEYSPVFLKIFFFLTTAHPLSFWKFLQLHLPNLLLNDLLHK